MSQNTRDQVFVSYSHKDKVWLDKLLTMLAPLVRTHAVSVWWDGEIEASQKWHVEIDRALDAAKVAVLLVSPHFLASDFINKNELPYLLDAAEQRSVKLIWVLVRDCLYDQTRIVDFQAAYPVSKPLNSLSEPELDTALVEICRVIGAAVSEAVDGMPGDDEGRSVMTENAVSEAAGLDTGRSDRSDRTSKLQSSKPASGALGIWMKKLAYMQEQEAITADFEQKFALQARIEEARKKIQELSG